MSENGTGSRDEGARLLQAGDAAGAVRMLRQAVAEDPSDARAFTYLGVAFARSGDPAGSLAALQEAARLQPEDAGVRYNLAVALSQAHQVSEARAEAERVLALNPEHAGARALMERLGGSAAPHVAPEDPSVPAAPDQAPEVETGFTPPHGDPLESEVPPAAVPGPAPPGEAGVPEWSVPAEPGGQGAPEPAPAPEGLHYDPSTAPTELREHPGLGKRLLRGWFWGMAYAQWWTVLMLFWMMVGGGTRGVGPREIGIFTVLAALVFGFFGSAAGLLIGAINAAAGTAVAIGVAAGITLCGIEVMIHLGTWFNLFFYFFTGRFIGARIWQKVMQPILR